MTNQPPPAAPPAPKPKGPPAAPPPPAPPAPTGTRTPRSVIPAAVPLEITSGANTGAHKILLYGSPGAGKSTAAAYLPGPLFFDVEDGSRFLNVSRVKPNTWTELRGMLTTVASSPPEGVRSVVVDSMTMAELFAKEHVVATRETDKGFKVDSIERFAFGKGWQFFSDEVDGLLMDCDRLVEKGINVCLVAHEISTTVPFPAAEDYLRWEPDLYKGGKDGRGSTRQRIKGWADHVVFVCFDVRVTDGKGRGSGTRTWHSLELPTHIAKSRTVQTSAAFELSDPGAVWRTLGVVSK